MVQLGTNLPQLKCLEAICDGKHPRKPWGVKEQGGSWAFNTGEEAEYPGELCSKVATAVVEYAASRGVLMVRHTPSDPSTAQAAGAAAALRAASGKQPRGNKFPELIPGFDEILKLDFEKHAWLQCHWVTSLR